MKKVILWIAVAVVALALIGCGLWFFIFRQADNKAEEVPAIQPVVEMTQEEAQAKVDKNTEIILASPENVDAALELADAYCALNQLDKVRESINRAASLVPSDTRSYDKMVSIYMNNNMLKEALIFIDSII